MEIGSRAHTCVSTTHRNWLHSDESKMALCVHHNQRFLVVSLFLILSLQGCKSDETLASCGTTIDLLTNANRYSGVLKVNMPTSFAPYQGAGPVQKHCEIVIIFGGGVNLQIELYHLDIMPVSSNVDACNTGLDVLQSNGRNLYGQRLCMEGWEWEERHRERKQEKKVVENSPLRFRLVSDGPYRGTGFKVHFNVFRPFWPCNNHREFKCERLQRCVHDDITCDGWDDCGDDSDESEDAGCELLTIAEIFAVIIGIFLFIASVAITVVFLIKYRRIIKRNRILRMESKLALEEERRSIREPVLSFPHRFNSMESMNKSQYSRALGQRMDIDSLMDKMELEKSDKYSCRDNMSERSHKSNRHRSYDNASDRYGPSSRRNRAASQSSLSKDKAGSQKNGSTHGSRPDLDNDAFDNNGDKESDRKRSKERRRYSDDEDYDSDRERRRRRRRSRDRRRYDRSDDDENDSESERRSRKSRDRYNSDEENDSDRERRRRRSRDRRRYDRSSDEDYDSDSERRRRKRSRDRRRYDSDEDYDSDRESRRRRSRDRRRYDRSSDEDYDSDRERRRRSRDRRRHGSDDNDSDRDRQWRKSRDRRSRDMSDDKDDKSQSRSEEHIEKNMPKAPEPVVKPVVEKPYNQQDLNNERELPKRDYHPRADRERQRKAEEEPIQKQRSRDLNHEPDNYLPPKHEDTIKKSNGVPAQETNGGNAWVPRSERKKNRRSRGDPVATNDDIYEDVVPKIHLENLAFREEAV